MLNLQSFFKTVSLCLVITTVAYPFWPGSDQEDFKKRQEKMEKYKTWRMTEYLDLSSEQSQQFFPKYNEFEDKIHQHRMNFMHSVLEVDSLLQQEDFQPTAEKYQKYLNTFEQMEQKQFELKQNFLQDVDTLLNTEQKIRFLIFEDKFKHEMMKKLREKHFRHKKPKK